MIDFKVRKFEMVNLLWGDRWHVTYPITFRRFEETMQERSVTVDYSSLQTDFSLMQKLCNKIISMTVHWS